MIIIFYILLLICIFPTIKDFIFIPYWIHWYLILMCFDREWIVWCSLKWLEFWMSRCNSKFFYIGPNSYKNFCTLNNYLSFSVRAMYSTFVMDILTIRPSSYFCIINCYESASLQKSLSISMWIFWNQHY